MKSPSSFIFLFFIFLLALSFNVLAYDLTAQFNKEFDLKRPCFNNGTYCSASAVCNLTITYPGQGQIMINNDLMSYNNSFFNYTLEQASMNQLGVFPAIMSCCDGVYCGADTFDIEVTADGNPSQPFPTEFFGIIFSSVLIGIGLIDERFRLFKTLGSYLMIVMGIITLYPGYSFINYSTLLGKGMGSVLIGLGFYFLIEHSFSRNEQTERYDQETERGNVD